MAEQKSAMGGPHLSAGPGAGSYLWGVVIWGVGLEKTIILERMQSA